MYYTTDFLGVACEGFSPLVSVDACAWVMSGRLGALPSSHHPHPRRRPGLTPHHPAASPGPQYLAPPVPRFRTQLWRIETGQAPLSLELLVRCRDLLQVSADRLVPPLADVVPCPVNDYDP